MYRSIGESRLKETASISIKKTNSAPIEASMVPVCIVLIIAQKGSQKVGPREIDLHDTQPWPP